MVDGSAQSGARFSISDICWNGGDFRRGLDRLVVEDCVCLLCEGVLIALEDLWEPVCLCLGMPCGSDCFLMRATAGQYFSVSNVVDLYDSGTGRWSTAQLSQARDALSATSVGTVAIFAGGAFGASKLLMIVFVCCEREC